MKHDTDKRQKRREYELVMPFMPLGSTTTQNGQKRTVARHQNDTEYIDNKTTHECLRASFIFSY